MPEPAPCIRSADRGQSFRNGGVKAARERAIFGEPSYCLEQIQQIRETLGAQQIMAWMNIGGMAHDKVLQSMRLFAERVLPALG